MLSNFHLAQLCAEHHYQFTYDRSVRLCQGSAYLPACGALSSTWTGVCCCLLNSCKQEWDVRVEWYIIIRQGETIFGQSYVDAKMMHGLRSRRMLFSFVCHMLPRQKDEHVHIPAQQMCGVLSSLSKIKYIRQYHEGWNRWPVSTGQKSQKNSKWTISCRWFKNPVNSPVEVGSWDLPLFTTGFMTIPGCFLGFLPSINSTCWYPET